MGKLKLDWIDVATVRSKRRKRKYQEKPTYVIMRHPDLTKEKYLVRVRFDCGNGNHTAEKTNSFDAAMAFAINMVTQGYRPMSEVEIKYV